MSRKEKTRQGSGADINFKAKPPLPQTRPHIKVSAATYNSSTSWDPIFQHRRDMSHLNHNIPLPQGSLVTLPLLLDLYPLELASLFSAFQRHLQVQGKLEPPIHPSTHLDAMNEPQTERCSCAGSSCSEHSMYCDVWGGCKGLRFQVSLGFLEDFVLWIKQIIKFFCKVVRVL